MSVVNLDETSTKLLLAAVTAAFGWVVRVGSKLDGRVKRMEQKMDGIRQDTQFFLRAPHFKDDTAHFSKGSNARDREDPRQPPTTSFPVPPPYS